MKKLTTALAALGVLGAGALSISGNASADTVKQPVVAQPIKAPIAAALVKTCGSVAAAKTQALGAGQIAVEAASLGGNYGVPGCDKFVVDTTVTSASLAPGSALPPFNFSYQPSGLGSSDKARCESSVVQVEFYKKAHGATGFTKIGGGTIKGNWSDSAPQFKCMLNNQAGFQSPPQFAVPGAGKTDVYRIAISSKELNQKTLVRGGLSHVPEPPK